jgi:hypothetical protein
MTLVDIETRPSGNDSLGLKDVLRAVGSRFVPTMLWFQEERMRCRGQVDGVAIVIRTVS